MACDIPFYNSIDLNQQEVKNVSFEKLAADPTGADLYEGRFWENTTDGKVKGYINGQICVFACEDWVTQEINKIERHQGSYDAGPGSLPVVGDKTVGDLTTLIAGDYWVVNNAGTITGIQGDDELSVGDKIEFLGGDPTDPNNWLGIQRNINDDLLGFLKTDRQTVASLPANTDTTISSSVISDIHSIQVYDSTGHLINVCVSKTANPNERVLHSNVALTNVVVELIGNS